MRYLLLIISFLLGHTIHSFAQKTFIVEGTVYDQYNRKPLEGVSVIKTGNRGVVTDSLGRYAINVQTGDSLWFSFLGKNTVKYFVDTITNAANFDLAIHIDARLLPDVKVRSSNYRLDSLLNRQYYAKAFAFKKPGLSISTTPNYVPGGLSVGFDLNEIINMFRFKHNRRMMSLQERLLAQEQDKYIDYRFSKRFVSQLTGLKGDELLDFMEYYRPNFFMLTQVNEIELGYYIGQCYKHYLNLRKSKPVPTKDILAH